MKLNWDFLLSVIHHFDAYSTVSQKQMSHTVEKKKNKSENMSLISL